MWNCAIQCFLFDFVILMLDRTCGSGCLSLTQSHFKSCELREAWEPHAPSNPRVEGAKRPRPSGHWKGMDQKSSEIWSYPSVWCSPKAWQGASFSHVVHLQLRVISCYIYIYIHISLYLYIIICIIMYHYRSLYHYTSLYLIISLYIYTIIYIYICIYHYTSLYLIISLYIIIYVYIYIESTCIFGLWMLASSDQHQP